MNDVSIQYRYDVNYIRYLMYRQLSISMALQTQASIPFLRLGSSYTQKHQAIPSTNTWTTKFLYRIFKPVPVYLISQFPVKQSITSFQFSRNNDDINQYLLLNKDNTWITPLSTPFADEEANSSLFPRNSVIFPLKNHKII